MEKNVWNILTWTLYFIFHFSPISRVLLLFNWTHQGNKCQISKPLHGSLYFFTYKPNTYVEVILIPKHKPAHCTLWQHHNRSEPVLGNCCLTPLMWGGEVTLVILQASGTIQARTPHWMDIADFARIGCRDLVKLRI